MNFKKWIKNKDENVRDVAHWRIREDTDLFAKINTCPAPIVFPLHPNYGGHWIYAVKCQIC